MTTSLGDSTGPVYGRAEVPATGVRERVNAARGWLLGPNRERMLVGLAVYTLWAVLLVRSIFGGHTSRAELLVLPPVLFAANARPRLAILATIPAAVFGSVVLSSWLEFRAYALVVGVAGLGVVTRRWRVLPAFHGTLLLLVITVVGSAFTNEAMSGALSVRILAIYTAMALLVMASAAMIRPRIDHVLLAIAVTGAAVGWVVIAGWFRMSDLTRSGALLRVFALGLNPNFLGVIVALGALAAIGLAVERRTWWYAVLAVPGVLALPNLKSRTALFLLAAGLVTIVVSLPGRRRRRLVIVLFVLVMVWVLDASFVDDINRAVLGARADLDLTGNDDFRRGVASYAFDQGLRNPLAGIGYGQFPTAAGAQFPIVNPSAHNELLRYFAELGVIGLGLLVAVMVQVGMAVRWSPMRTTAGVVLGAYALAMLTMEPVQSLPTSMGVMVLAGAVVGWAHAMPAASTAAATTASPAVQGRLPMAQGAARHVVTASGPAVQRSRRTGFRRDEVPHG